MNTSPVVFLIGPTAAGKSASSLALAKNWPIEIIAMDSATIYRDMDIGTAKPSLAERETIAHHLLDIVDPADSYDVATFVSDCIRLVKEIQARGHHAVICGGTLMYYHALTRGLSPVPASCPETRAHIEAQAAQAGWPAMHQRLTQIDPEIAQRIAPNDSQRIGRALEVYEQTGLQLSSWQKKPRRKDFQFPFLTLSIEPTERQLLHPRIRMRFQQMMEQGFLDEVRRLYDRGDLHEQLPSIRCVGYRQLWQHLQGHYDLESAIEKGIHATEQLAKRQMTWLRSLDERQPINCLADDVAKQVVEQVATQWARS